MTTRMTVRKCLALAMAAGNVAGARVAAAQVTTTPPPTATSSRAPDACATLNGIRIAADWGAAPSVAGISGSGASSPKLVLDSRTTIDTTIAFDIDDKQWTRPQLVAEVAAGVSGGASAGAFPRPGTGARGPWHACVGVLVGMRQPTLVLRGVRGQVHLEVDLSPLTGVMGSSSPPSATALPPPDTLSSNRPRR